MMQSPLITQVLNRIEGQFLAGLGTSKAYEDFHGSENTGDESLHAWFAQVGHLQHKAIPDVPAHLYSQENELIHDKLVSTIYPIIYSYKTKRNPLA